MNLAFMGLCHFSAPNEKETEKETETEKRRKRPKKMAEKNFNHLKKIMKQSS